MSQDPREDVRDPDHLLVSREGIKEVGIVMRILDPSSILIGVSLIQATVGLERVMIITGRSIMPQDEDQGLGLLQEEALHPIVADHAPDPQREVDHLLGVEDRDHVAPEVLPMHVGYVSMMKRSS